MSVQQIFLQHPTFLFDQHHVNRFQAAERNAWKAKAHKKPLATNKKANSGNQIKKSFILLITTTAIAWTLI